MPMIEHACPHCGRSLESDDYLAGMPMTCPSCEQSLRVPETSIQAPPRLSLDEPEPIDVVPAAEEPSSHVDESAFFHDARPDLYRVNSFRVADLSVDATAREITRQLDRVKMLEKVGGDLPPATGPLPLKPPPGADAVRDAVERLRDPEHRLVDEFFWFWPMTPGDSKGDAALIALGQSDAIAAANLWGEAAVPGRAGSVPRHNLAVLTHLQALDQETGAESSDGTDEQVKMREAAWSGAFRHWVNLLEDDDFWTVLTERIRDLNEPQLTATTARRMRTRLPELLLSINSALALRGAERGRYEEAGRQVALMKNSGLEASAVEEALRKAVNPIRERIKLMGKTAEDEADATPVSGLKASHRLADEAKPLLAVLDRMLGRENPLCEGAHDEIALRILGCQIPYANATEDWTNSLALVQMAYEIAVSESARSRLRTNLEIVEQNQRLGCCHFCQKSSRKDGAHAVVPMYGNVTRERIYNGWRLRWQQLDIKVPRCDACRQAHALREKKILLGGLLGGLVGFGGYLVMDYVTGQWFAALFVISACMILGGFLAGIVGVRQFPPGTQPEKYKYAYSEVTKLRADGWEFGSKPST